MEQITKSNILDFVSRHYAAFSAGTKKWADLEVQMTFSKILEFVKWSKKSPACGLKRGWKIFSKSIDRRFFFIMLTIILRLMIIVI